MTQWFQERYISRGEHQEIVDFYKKLVVQLHRKLKEMRARQEADAIEQAIAQVTAPSPIMRPAMPLPDYGGNVIRLDRRRRPGHSAH